MKLWWAFLLIVLVVSCARVEPLPENDVSTPDEPVTRTITEELPVKLRFDEYLSNPATYSLTRANVTGRLIYDVKKAQGNAGVYARFIVDDEQQRIELVGVPTTKYDWFPPKQASEEVYTVTGTFKVYYDGLVIDVKTLEETTRATVTVTRTVTD